MEERRELCDKEEERYKEVTRTPKIHKIEGQWTQEKTCHREICNFRNITRLHTKKLSNVACMGKTEEYVV